MTSPTPISAATQAAQSQPVGLDMGGIAIGANGVSEAIVGALIMIVLGALATYFRRSIMYAFKLMMKKRPWVVPDYRRTGSFTGREGVLQTIRQKLHEHGCVTLSGPGGIGKTQIALEFASRRRRAYRAGVFWVTADSEATINSGFVNAAQKLDLDRGLSDARLVIGKFAQWLDEHRNWLLILDNADEPAIVKPYLPAAGHGYVIMTSRTPPSPEPALSTSINVDKFTSEEATQFLLARTARTSTGREDAEAALGLADELGYYPLALEQAAVYIAETGSRFTEYLASFRKRGLELLAKGVPGQSYERTIATTLATNFEAVENESVASADVQRAMAFLHPNSIPLIFLKSGAQALGPAISEAVGDPADPLPIGELLLPLARFSLIRRNPNLSTFSVHRVIQELVLGRLDAGARTLWAERVVRAMNGVFAVFARTNFEVCDSLVPHIQSLANHVQRGCVCSEDAGNLLNDAALHLRSRARFAEAQKLFEQALGIREALYGTDDPRVATTLSDLAVVVELRGRYADAQRLQERALRIRQLVLGAEHPDVATSMSRLANVYGVRSRHAESLQLHERALEMRERLLGPEHPDTARSLNDLATEYLRAGRTEEAQTLYHQALLIREKTLPADDSDLAWSLRNAAIVLVRLRRASEARVLFERALSIWRKTLGPDHPDVAMGLNDLAALLFDQERYAEALPLYEHALKIREPVLGSDHHLVALSLHNLGLVLGRLHRSAEAQAHFERALRIFETVYGPDDPDVATTLNELALLHNSQRRYVEAQPLFERALKIREHALEPDNQLVAESLNNLAWLLVRLHRNVEANVLFQRARHRAETQNAIAGRPGR